MLMTFEDQQLIKEVSANNKKKFERIMKEVEELELDKLLGTTFYQDIVDNYDPDVSDPNDPYRLLVEGSKFMDASGNMITQKGLKQVLAYLNYSAYIQEAYVQDTFTGLVQKTRPDSESVSMGTIKNLQQHNREIAFNYFEKTREYLNLYSNLYPLYNTACEKRVKDFKLRGIRKTLK